MEFILFARIGLWIIGIFLSVIDFFQVSFKQIFQLRVVFLLVHGNYFALFETFFIEFFCHVQILFGSDFVFFQTNFQVRIEILILKIILCCLDQVMVVWNILSDSDLVRVRFQILFQINFSFDSIRVYLTQNICLSRIGIQFS